MFLPNYLASARRKHLPICVVDSFASHVACECITGESLLAGSFAFTFLLVRRHPAGSSVENKLTFGKVPFFFGQFNMDFCDSADKTLGKER